MFGFYAAGSEIRGVQIMYWGGRPRSDLRDSLSTADSVLGFHRVRQIGLANKIICYLFY